MILARDTEPGRLYRPTRTTQLIKGMRSVLRRVTPGREQAALARMEKQYMKLNGQEVGTFASVKAGEILFRKDTRYQGTTKSAWVAIPADYKLREVQA